MQKDIFDDIFDTTDDDNNDDDDPAPLIPTPTDFQVQRFTLYSCVHSAVEYTVLCIVMYVVYSTMYIMYSSQFTCTQYGGVKSTVV